MATPTRGGPTAAVVEKALAAIPEAAIRVGDVPPGREAFPVRIALTDPGELLGSDKRQEERFREVADHVVAVLMKDRAVAAPAAFPGPPTPQLAVEVDRDRCATCGVELSDLFTTFQTALGGVHATDFYKFGLAWRVTVQAEPQFTRNSEDLTQLSVRNSSGQMVALKTLLKVRKAHGPAAVVRVNGYHATIITGAAAAGKTPTEVAARCVKLAQEVLPRGHHVKDLTGP